MSRIVTRARRQTAAEILWQQSALIYLALGVPPVAFVAWLIYTGVL